MQFYADTLSLSPSLFTILRDLIHDHTGLFYEDNKRDILANKLSPRAIERGFDFFLDYYYLLKYDQAAEDEWNHVMDALSVQETYFWREIDAVQCAGAGAAAAMASGPWRRAAADLECGLRDRRRAADDCDGAGGGRMVRSSADRDLCQRCKPRCDHDRAARHLPQALIPKLVAGAARKIFH